MHMHMDMEAGREVRITGSSSEAGVAARKGFPTER